MFHHFRAISLAHQKAPVAVREQFSLTEAEVRNLLGRLAGLPGITEAMVLSTCNRTEIYYCTSEDQSVEVLMGLFAEKQVDDSAAYLPYFTILPDAAQAMEHLFRVAAGLESKELGDAQIYHQVKKAYEWAVEEETAGPFLHRLLHTVFHAHKRIIQETLFQDGATSLARVAAQLAKKLLVGLAQPTILLIGAGEIGADVCNYLSRLDQYQVRIINRSVSRAQRLASQHGFEWVPFGHLLREISQASIVISCVGIDQPLLTKKELLPLRRLPTQCFIDLGVPRSIESTVAELPGVGVYNVDDLQSETSRSAANRRAAVAPVEQILQESIQQFKTWADEMTLSPVIHQLKHALETIRQEELNRYAKKLGEAEKLVVESLTRSITQKFLKLPVLQLKAACKRGEAALLLQFTNELFNLAPQSKTLQPVDR